MADFEDANSPTWSNNLEGQINLRDAAEGTIDYDTGEKYYKLEEDPAVLVVRPRGWHLLERHASRRRRGGLRLALRLRPLCLPQPRAALVLHSEAREPSRSAPLERGLRLRGGGAPARARLDQGHGPDRERAGGVRDGRDPLRAARAHRRPERRPLGLPLQPDQAAAVARHRAARPRPADDDDALHARVHRAAREDLPPARRPRDGRDGRVHPEPARSRGERARAREGAGGQGARGGRRLRRHVGRAPRSRAGRDRGLRRRPRRATEPGRAAARRRVGLGAATRSTCASRAAPSPRRGCARTSASGSATSSRGSAGSARPRSTT